MLYIKSKLYIAHHYSNKYLPRFCYFIVVFIETMRKPFRKKHKPLVFIFGEPRSGTSFITQLAHKTGFYSGPFVWLKNANKFNPNGYFECVPFQNELDQLIEEYGFNFEHRLPEKPLELPKNIQIKLQKIVNDGNIELVKYNKLSLFADSISKAFPNAIWIHVQRDEKDLYKSNSKFVGGRGRESFFMALKKRQELWKQSGVSKHAISINYSTLKTKKDILNLLVFLQSQLEINLNQKQISECVSLFRPKHKI